MALDCRKNHFLFSLFSIHLSKMWAYPAWQRDLRVSSHLEQPDTVTCQAIHPVPLTRGKFQETFLANTVIKPQNSWLVSHTLLIEPLWLPLSGLNIRDFFWGSLTKVLSNFRISYFFSCSFHTLVSCGRIMIHLWIISPHLGRFLISPCQILVSSPWISL